VDLPVGTLPDLRDEEFEPTVTSSETLYKGKIFELRRDTVDLGDHGDVTREYLHHTGAVIVVALRKIDGVDHLVMIRQYRHPVRRTDWELPAGVRDVSDEPPWSPPRESWPRR
jgi:8-oxo-dGDP phosphatase